MQSITRLDIGQSGQITEIWQQARAKSLFPVGLDWNDKQVIEELTQGWGWGLFVDGQVQAFILGRQVADHWEINLLATRPGGWHKGQMKTLLSYVLEQRPKNCSIWLEAHEENVPALRLYESLGFEQVGLRPSYYGLDQASVLYTLHSAFSA